MSGLPLRLELRASPVLTLLTAAIHGVAAATLWFVLPPPAGICAAILLVILGTLALRDRALLWGPAAPVVLELKRDGSLMVRLRGGREIGGQPAARRYVSRWLVVLDLVRAPRVNRTILIARDMLPAGEFRHLRLWALWNALPGVRRAANA